GGQAGERDHAAHLHLDDQDGRVRGLPQLRVVRRSTARTRRRTRVPALCRRPPWPRPGPRGRLARVAPPVPRMAAAPRLPTRRLVPRAPSSCRVRRPPLRLEGRVEPGTMGHWALGPSSTWGETRRGLRVSPTRGNWAARGRRPKRCLAALKFAILTGIFQ